MEITENILNDSQLEEIAGGTEKKIQVMRVACWKCRKSFNVDMSQSAVKCPYCKTTNTFAG